MIPAKGIVELTRKPGIYYHSSSTESSIVADVRSLTVNLSEVANFTIGVRIVTASSRQSEFSRRQIIKVQPSHR